MTKRKGSSPRSTVAKRRASSGETAVLSKDVKPSDVAHDVKAAALYLLEVSKRLESELEDERDWLEIARVDLARCTAQIEQIRRRPWRIRATTTQVLGTLKHATASLTGLAWRLNARSQIADGQHRLSGHLLALPKSDGAAADAALRSELEHEQTQRALERAHLCAIQEQLLHSAELTRLIRRSWWGRIAARFRLPASALLDRLEECFADPLDLLARERDGRDPAPSAE